MVGASPAGRLLSLLERVQERPGRTAPELAADLDVSERTVRRYVATLQELGIPVEAGRGRYGGHRLRAGFRMPPLMLTTDEAVAITFALAVTRGSRPLGDGAADTALAKLEHVLPRGVSDQVRDVLVAISAPTEGWLTGAPDPGVLATLATGVAHQRQVRVRHRSSADDVTDRVLNPYGVVLVRGSCYVHAWCHLRKGRRTFRVDRIERASLIGEEFRMPALDVRAAVERSLALSWQEHRVSLLVDAPYAEAAPYFPTTLGVCESVDATTTRVRSSSRNLDYFVLRISDHPFAVTVEEPAELRDAFARAAERMAASAVPPSPSTSR